MVNTAVLADEVYSMRDGRQMPKNVLIVRLGAMGDILHALPAVHLIREVTPHCNIGWVVERRWLPLLCAEGHTLDGETSAQRPLVNHLHVVDTRAWRKSMLSSATVGEVRSAIQGIRTQHYDYAIDFQGAIKSSILASLAGAESVLGFRRPREAAARMFYSNPLDTDLAHVVDQNFALARDLVGDAMAPLRTYLPEDVAAQQWVSADLKRRGIHRYAILAPTAGWAAKEWPTENYGAVARDLAARGITPLVNFGPGEDSIGDRVHESSDGAAIPYSCSLAQLIALTRRASLFIGGDTGPMHLAAALQVPVVALFGPTDPDRNGPYGTRSRVLRNALSVTSYSHVSTVDPGLVAITPRQVLDAADSLLS